MFVLAGFGPDIFGDGAICGRVVGDAAIGDAMVVHTTEVGDVVLGGCVVVGASGVVVEGDEGDGAGAAGVGSLFVDKWLTDCRLVDVVTWATRVGALSLAVMRSGWAVTWETDMGGSDTVCLTKWNLQLSAVPCFPKKKGPSYGMAYEYFH